MNVPNNERRDWSLVIFIIPLGILLIVLVGQLAIRIFPNWSVNANMRSNLDPNAPSQPGFLLQPLLPQIMTPMAWAENYLDQGSDFTFPPFFVFEPTASASPSPTTVSPTSTTPSPTATTPSPSATPSVTSTSGGGGGGTPSPTCQDQLADNYGGPLPCDYTSTTCQDPLADNYQDPLPCDYTSTTCQDPLADNYQDPLPCDYTSTTCQDPLADNYQDPLPCDYTSTTCQDPDADNYQDPLPCHYPSTIDPSLTQATPNPAQLEIGDPDGDDQNINDGSYIVIPMSVQVGATPDGNYDLVFYEYNNNGSVYLDWIIIGLSHFADGSEYYEVFNWGNAGTPVPDMNSNVGDIAGTEDDNQPISLTELHDPDGDPNDPGPGPDSNQTGILIDVDNATSEPPPGIYDYIVIISPNWPGGTGDPAEIDAINTIEEPIPTP